MPVSEMLWYGGHVAVVLGPWELVAGGRGLVYGGIVGERSRPHVVRRLASRRWVGMMGRNKAVLLLWVILGAG